jgi:hypothetical protein
MTMYAGSIMTRVVITAGPSDTVRALACRPDTLVDSG